MVTQDMPKQERGSAVDRRKRNITSPLLESNSLTDQEQAIPHEALLNSPKTTRVQNQTARTNVKALHLNMDFKRQLTSINQKIKNLNSRLKRDINPGQIASINAQLNALKTKKQIINLQLLELKTVR